jgi:hypothetical protein
VAGVAAFATFATGADLPVDSTPVAEVGEGSRCWCTGPWAASEFVHLKEIRGMPFLWRRPRPPALKRFAVVVAYLWRLDLGSQFGRRSRDTVGRAYSVRIQYAVALNR